MERDGVPGVIKKPHLQCLGACRDTYHRCDRNACAAEMHSKPIIILSYRNHFAVPCKGLNIAKCKSNTEQHQRLVSNMPCAVMYFATVDACGWRDKQCLNSSFVPVVLLRSRSAPCGAKCATPAPRTVALFTMTIRRRWSRPWSSTMGWWCSRTIAHGRRHSDPS